MRIPTGMVRLNLQQGVIRQCLSKEVGRSVMMVIEVEMRKLRGGIGRNGKLNSDSYVPSPIRYDEKLISART
jgi:hypothetical protein